ncbi:hypothetical protein PQU92_16710 [Asticcacaulis sp. BYS171W]|uniref:Uncharacterized protein n=1 Tax=Asticcacaulis aquaticus TaxID=2984212 RepID=A0ABT5HXX1_9CAUL|nr:hypothetical protein [Asticcacaulis aquaticus]MDC7684927.1 hypothetical protein [Asticcacaulis aquaticus]
MNDEKRDIARLYGRAHRDYLNARYNQHKGGWPGGFGAILLAVVLYVVTQNMVLSAVFLVAALIMCFAIKKPAQPYSEVTMTAFIWGCYGVTIIFLITAITLYVAIMAFDAAPYQSWVTCPLIIAPWCSGQDENREKFWLFYNLCLLASFVLWFYAARQLPYRHNRDAPKLTAKAVVHLIVCISALTALIMGIYIIAPENEISVGYRYGPAPFYSGVGVLYFLPYAVLLITLFATIYGLLGYVVSRLRK